MQRQQREAHGGQRDAGRHREPRAGARHDPAGRERDERPGHRAGEQEQARRQRRVATGRLEIEREEEERCPGDEREHEARDRRADKSAVPEQREVEQRRRRTPFGDDEGRAGREHDRHERAVGR